MASGPGSGYTCAVNGGPSTTGPGTSASTEGAASGPEARAPVVPAHELLRRIGAGSYGEVWLARSALGTFRAVKIVRRAAFDDDRPYEREFAGLQKFEPISRTHEGFVDLLQVGRDDAEGWFYYVMELADDAAATSIQWSVISRRPRDHRGPHWTLIH